MKAKKWIAGQIAALAMALGAAGAAQAEWQPSGPVQLNIGFQAGGGSDTQARLLAEELKSRLGWDVVPQNIAGNGGRTMALKLKEMPADGLSLGFTVSDPLAYDQHAYADAGYTTDDFTFIGSVTEAQMAIVAKADRGWTTLGDVFDTMKAGENVTIGVQAAYLADGTYVIGRENGVSFTQVSVKGGRGGLNGVLADDLDLAWAAGPQGAGVAAGDLVNLASTGSRPLIQTPAAPLLTDYGVPYTFGSVFMVIAPKGLPEVVRETIATAIEDIVLDPESQLHKLTVDRFSGPVAMSGDEIDAFIARKSSDAMALINASMD